MQAAQTPQTKQLFFVSFSYNCDFTYDYFLVTLELFTILGPQPNLQFNRKFAMPDAQCVWKEN